MDTNVNPPAHQQSPASTHGRPVRRTTRRSGGVELLEDRRLFAIYGVNTGARTSVDPAALVATTLRGTKWRRVRRGPRC